MRVKEALAEAAGQAAVDYLKGSGFQVLDRNWRSGADIASIVAVDGRTFVIVDLRVRAGGRPGARLGAIGADRTRAMRGLAARWLAAHGMRFDRVRVDVVALLQDGAGAFTLEHVRAVG